MPKKSERQMHSENLTVIFKKIRLASPVGSEARKLANAGLMILRQGDSAKVHTKCIGE